MINGVVIASEHGIGGFGDDDASFDAIASRGKTPATTIPRKATNPNNVRRRVGGGGDVEADAGVSAGGINAGGSFAYDPLDPDPPTIDDVLWVPGPDDIPLEIPPLNLPPLPSGSVDVPDVVPPLPTTPRLPQPTVPNVTTPRVPKPPAVPAPTVPPLPTTAPAAPTLPTAPAITAPTITAPKPPSLGVAPTTTTTRRTPSTTATTKAPTTTKAPSTTAAPSTTRATTATTKAATTTSKAATTTTRPRSGTPTTAAPGPVTPGRSRVAHGPGRLAQATTTFGPPLGDVPKDWLSANLDRRRPDQAVNMSRNVAEEGKKRGAGNIMISVPLSWQGPGFSRDPNGSLASMEEVAGGRFDIVYEGIAKAVVDGGYPNAILRLGHEHNMAWTPWFSGEGRADEFVAAWRRAANAIRKHGPAIALDWNIGASGADPTQPGGGTFDPQSWPGDAYVDIVGRDIYCRANGRDINVIRRSLKEHEDFAKSHGKPLSYPEIGVSLPVGEGEPGKGNTAGNDDVCSVFIKEVLDFANKTDLAYFVWWASNRNDQGYRYRLQPSDTKSWQALNGFYK